MGIIISVLKAKFGFRVVAYLLENEISGLLVINPSGTTIAYNQVESRVRRRFTVAHELGHFILHRQPNKTEVFWYFISHYHWHFHPVLPITQKGVFSRKTGDVIERQDFG